MRSSASGLPHSRQTFPFTGYAALAVRVAKRDAVLHNQRANLSASQFSHRRSDVRFKKHARNQPQRRQIPQHQSGDQLELARDAGEQWQSPLPRAAQRAPPASNRIRSRTYSTTSRLQGNSLTASSTRLRSISFSRPTLASPNVDPR